MSEEPETQVPVRKPLAERLTLPGFTPSREALRAGGVTATPHTGSIPKIRDEIRPRRMKRFSRKTGTDKDATAPPVPPTKPKPKQRRRSPGWIPDQHGAWAMLVIPFWVGVYLSTLRWQHLLLFALWVVGYMCFFATGLWLKSRRKERYWAPVRTYGLVALILGAACVLVQPPLLEWAVVFGPLVAIAGWQSWINNERSLLARTATVLASGLMLLVTYDLGTGFVRSSLVPTWLQHSQPNQVLATEVGAGLSGWAWALCVAFWLTYYYWSTVPYVKTMVRMRGVRSYLVGSWIIHALGVAGAIGCALAGWTTWLFAAAWIALAARAVLFPVYAAHSPKKRVPVRAVGLSEVCFSILVIVTLLVRF